MKAMPKIFPSLFVGIVLALFIAICIPGCAVGPRYQRPNISIPHTYKEIPSGWKIAQPADRIDRGAWWQAYDDVQLNTLMDKLNQANQTIAQCAAAYRQARAEINAARAAYFPTVDLSAERGRASMDQSRINHNNNVKLEASWEIDLWNKVSHTTRAQKENAEAAAADLANARLSAQAMLAQTYFQLRMTDAIQRFLNDQVSLSQQSLQLVENQFRQGAVSRADVLLAQAQLQSAQSIALDNGIARAKYEHAIATLLGEPASTFSLHAYPLTAALPQLPLGVPSALLERRPDIAAAERRVAAANEQIGVAMAAFFPTLRLSAAGGFQSAIWSQLFTLPTRFWSVGPQLAATLFDGGARTAKIETARASYDKAVAFYRTTVLSAFQEVEDNLASQNILRQEVIVQRQAIKSAQQALAITMIQFKAGKGDYLKVLAAQITLFNVRQHLTKILGQQMVVSVSLVKALGGGWDRSRLEEGQKVVTNGNQNLRILHLR